LVITLLWDWWTARSKTNAGEKTFSTDEVCYQIRKHLSEYTVSDSKENTTVQQDLPWTPPPANYVKVNFDAAFCQDTQRGAWGFIARDDRGSFLAGGARSMSNLSSALHAEASACIHAIECVSNLGAFRIVFESDCLNLVNALNSGEYDLSHLGVLFREARSLCYGAFDTFDFTFCKRSCNRAAHAIAQHGKELGAMHSLARGRTSFCIGLGR
jgi:ribonuclease HI